MTPDPDDRLRKMFEEFERGRAREREYHRTLTPSPEPLDPPTDLQARIETAFANTPPPAPDDITRMTYDDEGVADYFRGTPWHGHAVKDLRRHSAALSFFTPAAFRYYLPAFMLAELQDPTAADVIAQDIIHGLSPRPLDDFWYETQSARLAAFTPPEKQAIADFVKYHRHQYDHPDELETRVILASLTPPP